MDEAIDWPGLMRLGLGVMRLPPEVFWSMTPAELRHAMEGAGLIAIGGAAMTTDRLNQLMQAFPDLPGGPDHT